jgi:hypothetical protein
MTNLNLENKGFSTEIRRDKTCKVSSDSQILKLEDTKCEEFSFDANKPLYGMNPEEYLEGLKFHNECFGKLINYQSN